MKRKKNFKVSEASKRARSELIALSAELHQTKVLLAATTGVQLTTNDLLLDTYKQQTGAKRFLRLQEWRDLGYKVKKGEKSFRIWGSPILVKKGKRDAADTDAESAYEHWPMCCLFSEQQVERYVPADAQRVGQACLSATA